jgi:hypothetical protein
MLRETVFLLTASCLLVSASNVPPSDQTNVASAAAAKPAAESTASAAGLSDEQLFYMSDVDQYNEGSSGGDRPRGALGDPAEVGHDQHEDEGRHAEQAAEDGPAARDRPEEDKDGKGEEHDADNGQPPGGPAEVARHEESEEDDWVDRDLPEEDNDQEEEQRDGETDGPAQEDEPWREPYKQMTFMKLLESGFKWNYENQYNKINKYLVEKTVSENVEDNMRIAAEWLEEQQKFVLPFWNGATIEALKQFLDLTKLNEEDVRCSRKAYVILWRNNQATKNRALYTMYKRRIDSIVRHFRIKHAVNCYTVYPGRFNRLCAIKDDDKVRSPMLFYEKFPDASAWLGDSSFATIAYGLISNDSLKANDPDNKYCRQSVNEIRGGLEVNEAGVRRLAQRYVIEPCRQFLHLTGPEIFIPASFDQLALKHEDRYEYHSAAVADFLKGRQFYRVCEKLVRHDSETLVKGLLDIVRRIPPERNPVW